MREPPVWWGRAGWLAAMLAPAAALYGAVAARRLATKGQRVAAPVVCIGNPTVGGAGKTPLALAVMRMLADAGERPVILTRGYGGKLAGPLRVDPTAHRAADVGDEPLLLARAVSTIVARDRVAGAQAACALGASVIVMDDGFQNPSLAKDFAVLVVDARRGVGNGHVIPAGPLRAPLAAQLALADALVIVGDGSGAVAIEEAARTLGIPVLTAALVPDQDAVAALSDRRVLAFAGIGDPEKFFLTLRDAGVVIAAQHAFADHHRYTRTEARDLCAKADREGLLLVTTEKDVARMERNPELAELAKRSHALPVTLALIQEPMFRALMMETIARARTTAMSV
jgi:tetraacyldisaccharide 4'-kinase